MHYFKDNTGKVYAYDTSLQAIDGLLPISESEAMALVAASSPSPDIPELIAAERYKRETGGIVINGMPIETTDRSKTLIAGSALKAMRNSNYVLRWKTPEGFVGIPAPEVLVIADAVSEHVQACFDREEELLIALAGGTFTQSMLEEGWPA